MAPTYQTVSLADIALVDVSFRLTYQPQLDALRRSIAQVGVTTPLHLRRFGPTLPLQIICGFKRLQVCQELQLTEVCARVYEVTDLSDEQAFCLAFYDNLGCRVFNVVEKARVLWQLEQTYHYEPSQLIRDICPLLELPPRAETLEAYRVFATLSEAVHAATLAGTLPLETAVWLGRKADAEHQALLPLFTHLRLGINRAREIAMLIDEICRRDACPVHTLFHEMGLDALLADGSMSGPQKIERVRHLLYHRRYPHLSAYEQRFQVARQQLKLPAQVTLRPPAYFDGSAYQVGFRFGSPQELQQVAQHLLDAASEPALDDLLDLL